MRAQKSKKFVRKEMHVRKHNSASESGFSAIEKCVSDTANWVSDHTFVPEKPNMCPNRNGCPKRDVSKTAKEVSEWL